VIGGTQAVAARLVAGKTSAVVPGLWPQRLSAVWLYTRPASVGPRRWHAAGAAAQRGRWRVWSSVPRLRQGTTRADEARAAAAETPTAPRRIRAGRAPPPCARQPRVARPSAARRCVSPAPLPPLCPRAEPRPLLRVPRGLGATRKAMGRDAASRGRAVPAVERGGRTESQGSLAGRAAQRRGRSGPTEARRRWAAHGGTWNGELIVVK